jgi:hypothetical protein
LVVVVRVVQDEMRNSTFSAELLERILRALGWLRPPARSEMLTLYSVQRRRQAASISTSPQQQPLSASTHHHMANLASGAATNSGLSFTPNTPNTTNNLNNSIGINSNNAFSNTPSGTSMHTLNTTPSPTISASHSTTLSASNDREAAQRYGGALRRIDPWLLLEEYDGAVCPTLFGGEKVHRTQLRYASAYL